MLPLAETVESLGQWETMWSNFLSGLMAFLPRLLSAALILLIAFLLIRLLKRPINALLKRTRLDEVAVKYIHRCNKICIWALAFIMALDQLGFPVSSLLAVVAAVGAAVALAIKDNLSNLASGIVLLFTKPFKAGDYIEVDETAAGTIREIELMQTYLDTVGNTLIAIPNSKMMNAVIVNYSAHETRRNDLVFSIGYGDDLLKAKAVLQQLADSHPMILKDPPPVVYVKEHAASSVQLLLRFWCQNSDYWDLQFDLMEQVKLLFDQNGISIPFNQLDVHMIPAPVPEKPVEEKELQKDEEA